MPKKNTQEQSNLNQLNQEQDQLAENNLPESNQEQEQQPEPEPVQLDYFFGNQDSKKEFKLPNDWAKKVCVWQCQIDQMNGGIVEIPNTHQLQTYEPKTYEKLSADAKGQPSFFSESKMKVTVLHDPR